jgi:subtilisin-like proprotein convertase family protein
MHRSHRDSLRLAFAAAGVSLAPSLVLASVVDYSTCPGYPLTACPSGWSERAIPDNNANGVTIELNVLSDGENFITDVNPWVYITHTWQGDLRIVLTSPAGTSVELVNRPGSPGCGGNGFSADDLGYLPPNLLLREFVLDDSAAASYNNPTFACPGVNFIEGTFRPVAPLSAFYGQSKVGTWRLFIQDLAGSDVGTLWVWGMTIRTEPATPPIVDLAIPDDYACGCSGAAITGTAADPDGTFSNYRLEWAVDSSGPWNLIATSNSPVNSGVLGTFPAASPEGFLYVRLIATNVIGMSSTFVKVIHADRTFGGAGILEPQDGDIVGGSVCMDRVSASDYCFASAALAYAPQGGSFTTFYSTTSPPSEFPPWNTAGLADGSYTLRVSGTTTCGNTASDTVPVVIDNTAPVATIASPANCAQLSGSVPVTGTVTDAHLSGWVLQYTGGAIHGWQTIASGSGPVVNGPLATWNTAGLPDCAYTLRLLASDASTVSCFGSNSAEYLVSVKIGGSGSECIGDLNDDGVVNISDLALFLAHFGTICP